MSNSEQFTVQGITSCITAGIAVLNKAHCYEPTLDLDCGRDFVQALDENGFIDVPEVIYDADAFGICVSHEISETAELGGFDPDVVKPAFGTADNALQCVLAEAQELVRSAGLRIRSQIGDDIDDLSKELLCQTIQHRGQTLFVDEETLEVSGANGETAKELSLTHVTTVNLLDNNVYRDGNVYVDAMGENAFIIASHGENRICIKAKTYEA